MALVRLIAEVAPRHADERDEWGAEELPSELLAIVGIDCYDTWESFPLNSL